MKLFVLNLLTFRGRSVDGLAELMGTSELLCLYLRESQEKIDEYRK